MKAKSTDSMKSPRLVARIMSAIFVGFFLFMFIGEAMQSANAGRSDPMPMYVILQLCIGGIGLLGLALAWKWEIAGGLLSLISFVVLFFVNKAAFVAPMLIFPFNAIFFIAVGYKTKEEKKDIAN